MINIHMTYSILLWNINWHHMIAFSDHVTTSSEVLWFCSCSRTTPPFGPRQQISWHFGIFVLFICLVFLLVLVLIWYVWFRKKKKKREINEKEKGKQKKMRKLCKSFTGKFKKKKFRVRVSVSIIQIQFTIKFFYLVFYWEPMVFHQFFYLSHINNKCLPLAIFYFICRQ